MLYITTRNDRDAYTAYRALHENTAPDGGVFVPFRMPVYSQMQIAEMAKEGFGNTVANILNHFFSCRLTGWDVDFCIGRNAVKLVSMPHRIVVAELWHNPDGLFEHIISGLYNKICDSVDREPSDWFSIAARIAVLFGLYGEMIRLDLIKSGESLDISLPADDFSITMVPLYARQMGLPIGKIICTGEKNGKIWDFIHMGELALTSEETLNPGFERLVQSTLGFHWVHCLADCNKKHRTFRIRPEELEQFNYGLFCAVAGDGRSAQMVNSVFRSNSYILPPETALCFGGLQDYRARSGESKLTLILSDVSPMLRTNIISEATGIAGDKLYDLLKQL